MGIPPTIEVANLSMADSLILMVMALVVFGPRRLPQIGRQIGKLMYEFRKASNDFKFQMEEELRNAEEADRRKKEEEERQRQLAANPPAQLEAGTPAATETPATESSYPYSGTYGEIAEAQAQAESTYPTIQPPATGEPVPAAWAANETAISTQRRTRKRAALKHPARLREQRSAGCHCGRDFTSERERRDRNRR